MTTTELITKKAFALSKRINGASPRCRIRPPRALEKTLFSITEKFAEGRKWADGELTQWHKWKHTAPTGPLDHQARLFADLEAIEAWLDRCMIGQAKHQADIEAAAAGRIMHLKTAAALS